MKMEPAATPSRLLSAREEIQLAAQLRAASAETSILALESAAGRAELSYLVERAEAGDLPVWDVIRRRGGPDGRALSQTQARRQLVVGLERIDELMRESGLAEHLASNPDSNAHDTALGKKLEKQLARLQLTEWAKGRVVCAATGTLPAELEQRLRRAERRSRRARTRFIAANQGLVSASARAYAHQGLGFHDLTQEGNLGLMRAVDKFDPGLGYRFSTYAVWWIRHAIRRALSNQSRTIRLPVHATEDRATIRESTERLKRELGRAPSDAELAEAAGFSAEKIKNLSAVAGAPISLDQGADLSGRLSLSECLGDPTTEDPCNTIARSNARRWLLEHLGELAPREREMVNLRYGLTGRRAHTLKEVGNQFGVTRERARQIVVGAVQKLRQAAQLDPVDSPS